MNGLYYAMSKQEDAQQRVLVVDAMQCHNRRIHQNECLCLMRCNASELIWSNIKCMFDGLADENM